MADKPVAEVVDVDAVIDALSPSPTSSDVYEATLPFNPHAVAASAVRRAGEGGGGSQSLSVIGPFIVNWDDAGILDGTFKICDLAAGTIVVKAWAFFTTPWATNLEVDEGYFTIGIGGSDWATGDWWDLFRYDPTWNLQNEFSGIEGHLQEPTPTPNDARQVAGIVYDAGALNAYAQPGAGSSFTAGVAEVYALILAPS